MEQIFIVLCASLLGGFVQAITGFGGAIIIMIFLPLILSMNAAPALSDVITMTLSFSMFWQYRKSVRFKSLPVPAIIYLISSTCVIYASSFFDANKLKIVFGLFLIVLACYFFAFSGKFAIRPSLPVNIVCASLAGVCGGLFGISGPPISLYYLAATKTKEEYLGTLNAFFSITVLFNIASRIANGFMTADLLPFMAIGIVAILVGCKLGSRISHRIELPVMRKCVYALMMFAGAVTIIQSFIKGV